MPDSKEYIDLAKINAENHKTRQGLEWKICFALWGGMALAIWLLLDKKITFSVFSIDDTFSLDGKWLFMGAYAVMLLTIILCVIEPLHRAHMFDRRWQHYYMTMAAEEPSKSPVSCAPGTKPAPDEPPKPPTKPPWCRSLIQPWAIAQIITTVVLLFFTLLVVLGLARSSK